MTKYCIRGCLPEFRSYIIDLNCVVEVVLGSRTFSAITTSRHENLLIVIFHTWAQCTVVIYGTAHTDEQYYTVKFVKRCHYIRTWLYAAALFLKKNILCFFLEKIIAFVLLVLVKKELAVSVCKMQMRFVYLLTKSYNQISFATLKTKQCEWGRTQNFQQTVPCPYQSLLYRHTSTLGLEVTPQPLGT